VGPEGERSYGYRHFLDLTSAFTSSPLFVVRYGARDLGQIAPLSLLNPDRSLATVLLGGHSWKITSIDWRRKVAWVEPSEQRGRSRWHGGGQPWSYELSQSIRSVLGGEDPAAVTLTQRAQDRLAESRAEMPWARSEAATVVRDGSRARWWTWAGEQANLTLADALGDLRGEVQPDNLSIAVDADRGTAAAIRERLEGLDVDHLPMPSVTAEVAEHLKFSDCLPTDLAMSVAAARLVDRAGVAAVVGAVGRPPTTTTVDAVDERWRSTSDAD
jgi:ATP-dependent Lhr-like helicase